MLKQRLDVLMLRSGEAIDAAMIKQNGLLDLLKAAMASIRLDEEVLDSDEPLVSPTSSRPTLARALKHADARAGRCIASERVGLSGRQRCRCAFERGGALPRLPSPRLPLPGAGCIRAH